MQFEGRYDLGAEPEQVWGLLNNPDILRKCIPGCDELIQISPVKYDAVVVLRFGAIKAKFRGNAEMTQQHAPNQCVIVFQGSGGITGMARGEAKVVLSRTTSGTQLSYIADVVIGGKIAQIGSKLIAGTARNIADKFFSSFAGHMSANVS